MEAMFYYLTVVNLVVSFWGGTWIHSFDRTILTVHSTSYNDINNIHEKITRF